MVAVLIVVAVHKATDVTDDEAASDDAENVEGMDAGKTRPLEGDDYRCICEVRRAAPGGALGTGDV